MQHATPNLASNIKCNSLKHLLHVPISNNKEVSGLAFIYLFFCKGSFLSLLEEQSFRGYFVMLINGLFSQTRMMVMLGEEREDTCLNLTCFHFLTYLLKFM